MPDKFSSINIEDAREWKRMSSRFYGIGAIVAFTFALYFVESTIERETHQIFDWNLPAGAALIISLMLCFLFNLLGGICYNRYGYTTLGLIDSSRTQQADIEAVKNITNVPSLLSLPAYRWSFFVVFLFIVYPNLRFLPSDINFGTTFINVLIALIVVSPYYIIFHVDCKIKERIRTWIA